MDQKPRVLVTGISGYVGAQVCYYFLQHGGFRVRGTMRSITDQAKKSHSKIFEHANIEVVEADLKNEQSIIDACEGCDYIVHTASPVAAFAENAEELIRPAVDGTLAAMKGALKHKAKRVVVTSSIVSISAGPEIDSEGHVKMNFNASDWTDPEKCGDGFFGYYSQSKTYAEKAAWDFQKNLKEEDRFELITINPGVVFGPALNERYSAGGDFVKGWAKDGFVANMPIPCVDVRDVAQAHLQAILKPEAAGKRFILVERVLYFSYAFNIFADMLKSKTLEKVENDGDETKKQTWDNSPTKEILEIPFISYETYTKDMYQDMIEKGVFEQ